MILLIISDIEYCLYHSINVFICKFTCSVPITLLLHCYEPIATFFIGTFYFNIPVHQYHYQR